MKPQLPLLAAGLIVLGGMAAWYSWPSPTPTLSLPAATTPSQAGAPQRDEAWPPKPGDVPAAVATAPGQPVVDQRLPAVLSMAEAREHGDDRAPPMAPRHGEDREPPTQAELDDPARYQQYSERQERRVYSAYVKAADGLLPQLDRDIARARAEGGITPEQIAKAEEKRRRIAEMQAELTEKLQANP